MDHRDCPVPSQVTWENNLSPLNVMHIHQQNLWNDVLFYWYQWYDWYQWTIGLTNRIRLRISDMCGGVQLPSLLSQNKNQVTLQMFLIIKGFYPRGLEPFIGFIFHWILSSKNYQF